MEKQLLIRNKLTGPIKSLLIGKDDLYRLLQILQERSHAAGDLEVNNFQQLDQTDVIFEENKKTIKEGFELKITLVSSDEQEFWGTIDEVFESPNYPTEVKSIYIGSEIPLQVSYNFYPRNSFQLFIDFSKLELFNLSFLPSQATPNESKMVVQGYDSTWVNGLYHEIDMFLKKHPARLTWIHKHSIYDLLLWLLGFPFGFWVTYKLSGLLIKTFSQFSIFVQNAAYVYVFLASLVLFRLLFHYARWVQPPVEYIGPTNKALKHRVIVGAVILGLIITLIYDLMKVMF